MRLYLMVASVIAGVGSVIYAGTRTSADYVSVHAVIDSYFEGAQTATSAPFEKAWELENGRIVFVHRMDGVDTVRSVPIKDAIAQWTSKPAAQSWGRVHSIDVVDGQMAVVKVEMLYRGRIYIDLLSLYKINKEWKIVNKTFVRRD